MSKTPPEIKTPRSCPNCGAGIKFDSRKDSSKGYPYQLPTTYLCGSVSSVHWSRSLIYCKAKA